MNSWIALSGTTSRRTLGVGGMILIMLMVTVAAAHGRQATSPVTLDANRDAVGGELAYQFDLRLDSRTASLIGKSEMPLRETLLRGLTVAVRGESPVRLAVFAATVRNRTVTSVWWSATFPAAPGTTRVPGANYLPGDIYMPGDVYAPGDLYLPDDLYVPADMYLPGDKYNASRSFGILRPPSGAVPVHVRQIAESGVVFGKPIDWRRQHVLYLAIVPVDGATAAITRSRGIAFAKSMPDY